MRGNIFSSGFFIKHSKIAFGLCFSLNACISEIPFQEYQASADAVSVVDSLPTDKMCVSVALVSLQAQSLDHYGALERLKYEVSSRNGNTLILESEEQKPPLNTWKLKGKGYGCDL